MGRLIDLSGLRFAHLTVLDRAGSDSNSQALWRCRCDCGNIVCVRSRDLRSLHSRSCGCLQIEKATETIQAYHSKKGFDGHTQTLVYQAWRDMMRRCYDRNSTNFSNYGGRGITVCSVWHDFYTFREWADKHGFKKGLQIDRIDNNGSYSPMNCRFTTRVENCNNKRNNHLVEFNGCTKTLAEWAVFLNLPYDVIRARLSRRWSIKRAFTEPIHIEKSRKQ